MINGIRHIICAAAMLSTVAVPFSAPSTAAVAARASAVVQQTVHAGPYILTLRIGPLEHMYTQAQVKKSHPKVGEVMIRGTMAMGNMGMNMGDGPNHHLELHVVLRSSNKPATDAMVAITIVSPKGKVLQHVPIAVMQGIKEGAGDLHYGNNVLLKDGRYLVRVQVEHTKATFSVTLSSSTTMAGM